MASKGNANMRSVLDVSNYQISPLEARSIEKIREFMEIFTSRLRSQGVQVSNIKANETIINGNKAFEITMDAADTEGKKGTLYEVGIFQEKTSSGLLFIGTDNSGNYLSKFKATAQSIKL